MNLADGDATVAENPEVVRLVLIAEIPDGRNATDKNRDGAVEIVEMRRFGDGREQIISRTGFSTGRPERYGPYGQDVARIFATSDALVARLLGGLDEAAR